MQDSLQRHLECPFTVIIDTREHVHPYKFLGFHAGAEHQYRPLKVATEWKALKSGDYSIAGYEDRIAIERKTLADFYNSVGQERNRFERECQRLAEMEYAAVVIEASWKQVIKQPPSYTKLKPIIPFRTHLSWEIRYPKLHFKAMEDRELAEVTTFRLLEKFWNEQHRRKP
jgi:ERCC4-type nuclease